MQNPTHPSFGDLTSEIAVSRSRGEVRHEADGSRGMTEHPWIPVHDNIRLIRGLPRPHDDLFYMAQEIPGWWDLLKSSPVLAFMVARCWCFDGLPKEGFTDRIAGYVLLRRRDICKKLGFPAEERTVRLLERYKMSSEDQTPLVIADLKILCMLLRWEPCVHDVLRDEEYGGAEIARLATGMIPEDWPEDTPELGHLQKLGFRMSLPSCEWFFQLAAPMRYRLANLYAMATYTQTDKTVMAFLEELPPLRRFRNERKAGFYLQRYLQRVRTIVEAHNELLRDTTLWPSAPLEPIDGLEPIRSFDDLEHEASEMNHCVVSYADRILLGDYYVYRMEAPVRGTVGIRWEDHGWVIDQARGVDNVDLLKADLPEALHAWVTDKAYVRDDGERRRMWSELSRACGLPLRRSFIGRMPRPPRMG